LGTDQNNGALKLARECWSLLSVSFVHVDHQGDVMLDHSNAVQYNPANPILHAETKKAEYQQCIRN